jgi:hypothetical protein
MAFKQLLPADWIRQRQNLSKLPFLYNLDDAVGLGCPNRRLDVMLLQLMLFKWSKKILQLKGPWYGFNILPVNGIFDNRLLAWIFGYQVMQWEKDLSAITGKALPIRGVSDLNGRNVIADLNLQLIVFRGENLRFGEFTGMASAADTPQELAQALKKER